METLTVDRKDLITKPLWFHKQNLMQTATGYGKALKTEYMMKYKNRTHRVFCCIFSNSGTLYIKTKETDVILNVQE